MKLGDISRRTSEAYKELCKRQRETLESPTPEAMQIENEAATRWQRLAELEEDFLKQCAKVHWLDVGDGNNVFFISLRR